MKKEYVFSGGTRGKLYRTDTLPITLPEPAQVLASIANVQATMDNDTKSIEAWRQAYMQDLETSPQRPFIKKFNSFVNSLLERVMPGEAWMRRAKEIDCVSCHSTA